MSAAPVARFLAAVVLLATPVRAQESPHERLARPEVTITEPSLSARLAPVPMDGRLALQPDTGQRAPGRKSPVAAAVLGLVLPGAGHWYAREPGRGALIAAVYWTGAALVAGGRTDGVGKTGGVLLIGALATSVIDGARAARRANDRR